MGILKELGEKKNVDIVLTTHSPALLDAATPELVRFTEVVFRNNEGYSEIKLIEEIDMLPKLLASGRMGKISARSDFPEILKELGDAK